MTSRSMRAPLLAVFAIVGVSLALLCWVSGGSDYLLLRGIRQQQQPQQPTRKRHLQGIGVSLLNAFISVLTPAISGAVRNTIRTQYDTVVLGENEGVYLGDVTVSTVTVATFASDNETTTTTATTAEPNCTTTGQVKYEILELSGLSNIQFETLEFVPGSQDIQIPRLIFNRDGEDTNTYWSGQWKVIANFANLTAATLLQMEQLTNGYSSSDSVCNETQQETAKHEGIITLEGVSANILVTISGKTERILNFAATSYVDAGRFDSLDIDIKSITTNLGTFVWHSNDRSNDLHDNGQMTFNVDAMFGEAIQTGLREYLNERVIFELQDIVDVRLPTKIGA